MLGVFILVAVIIFFFWTLNAEINGNDRNESQTHISQSNTLESPLTSIEKLKDKKSYRPKSNLQKPSKISFTNPGEGEKKNILNNNSIDSEIVIDGLNDAFTGAPLNKELGLYQCTNCKVFYHTESFKILIEQNSSSCVACQRKSIISISKRNEDATGRNFTPDLITLDNYKDHIGTVITFIGKVEKIRVSQRGIDYAAMFENKSWTNGFKLVFFGGDISKFGGAKYIEGLEKKNIKVRGLLQKHSNFGYQIIISQKSMILDDGNGMEEFKKLDFKPLNPRIQTDEDDALPF